MCAFGRSTELSAFFLAGATGLEPATSSVTGQRLSSGFRYRFNFSPGKSRCKGQRFDFSGSKVESRITLNSKLSGLRRSGGGPDPERERLHRVIAMSSRTSTSAASPLCSGSEQTGARLAFGLTQIADGTGFLRSKAVAKFGRDIGDASEPIAIRWGA
jgi:hypothetical protein